MAGEAMSPVPTDHPLRMAWERYRRTDDYENTVNWLHRDGLRAERDPAGELWAAFLAGWQAAGGDMP